MEMMIGLVETFVLAWLIGASIAGIYNSGISAGDELNARALVPNDRE